jgi:TatD DNase family protein
LIDSHCHLDYAPAADDVEACLQRGREAGVQQYLHIGCSVDRLDPAIALVDEHESVFASVGIHPHDATTLNDSILEKLEELAAHPKVLAIGETGLDYYYDRSPREVQQGAMARQLELARALDMPLVLHIRDAHQDALDVVGATETRDDPGIVHCFTGDRSEAQRWLDLGWHISFSGIVTFKSATDLREAAKLCPLDRMLVETDAPFLAPEPNRGRKNEPANVAFTCFQLAELRGEDPAKIAEATNVNARRILRMPEPNDP